MQTTITEDGTHLLLLPLGRLVTHHSTSIVRILGNDDGATVLVGEDDGSGNISLFFNGDITNEGAAVNHGKGSKLMVNVTGISANPVIISVKEM